MERKMTKTEERILAAVAIFLFIATIVAGIQGVIHMNDHPANNNPGNGGGGTIMCTTIDNATNCSQVGP